jgi:hypothetical protein
MARSKVTSALDEGTLEQTPNAQESAELLSTIEKHVSSINTLLTKPQDSKEAHIKNVEEEKAASPLEKITKYMEELFSNESKEEKDDVVGGKEGKKEDEELLNKLDKWAEKLDKILSSLTASQEKPSSPPPVGQISSPQSSSPVENNIKDIPPGKEAVSNISNVNNKTSTSNTHITENKGHSQVNSPQTSSSSKVGKTASTAAEKGGTFQHEKIYVADKGGEAPDKYIENPTHKEITVLSHSDLQKLEKNSSHFESVKENIPHFVEGTKNTVNNISSAETYIQNLPLSQDTQLSEKETTNNITKELHENNNFLKETIIPKFSEGTQSAEQAVNSQVYNGGDISENRTNISYKNTQNTNNVQNNTNKNLQYDNVVFDTTNNIDKTSIPRFYDGTDLVNASSLGTSSSFALPDMPLANTGIATTSEMFIVGDKKGVNPTSPEDTTSELVINPTKAPIVVKSNQETKGILDDDSFIPKFAQGSADAVDTATNINMAGQGLAGAIGAGAGTSSASDVIGGFSQALGTMIPSAQGFILVMESIAQSAVGVVQGFNKLAESVATFSPEISNAMMGAELLKMDRQMNVADKEGGNLAQLYTSSSQVWEDTKKILFDISRPFLSIIVPMVELSAKIIEKISHFVEIISDALQTVLAPMAKWFTEGWSAAKKEFAKRWDDLMETLNKGDKSKGHMYDEYSSGYSGAIGAQVGAMLP